MTSINITCVLELFVISATTKKIGCVYGNNDNDNDDDDNDNNDTIQRLTSLAHKIILIACRLDKGQEGKCHNMTTVGNNDMPMVMMIVFQNVDAVKRIY